LIARLIAAVVGSDFDWLSRWLVYLTRWTCRLLTRFSSLVIRAVGDLVRYAVRSSVLPFVGSLVVVDGYFGCLVRCCSALFVGSAVCYADSVDCGYVGYAVTVWLRWTRYCVVDSLLRCALDRYCVGFRLRCCAAVICWFGC
jgi:hypothetical protein